MRDIENIYRSILSFFCIATYSPEYRGFDKIPAEGAGVIIANHVSYADGLIIASGCKRPIRFIIDTQIYNLPIVNYLMRLNRAIPIESTRESVTAALEEIAQGLQAGDLICIFPEGQLTYTGGLGRFKTGIESIIKRNPVPVYPIALGGLWGSMFSRKYLGSWKRFVPKSILQNVRAICGDPIPPELVTVNYLQEIIMKLKYSR